MSRMRMRMGWSIRGLSPFSPLDLTNLAGWWAADLSPLTMATGVSQANDLSGNARHVTQGTAANQPGLGTINGRQAFVMDTDAYFLANTALTAGQTAFSVFAAIKPANVSAGVRYIWRVAPERHVIYQNGATLNVGGKTLDGDATKYVNGGAVLTTGMHVVGVVANYGAGTITAYHGATAVATDALATAGTTSAVNQNTWIGSSASSFIGETGEKIVIRGVPTAAEIARINTYLAARWGAA